MQYTQDYDEVLPYVLPDLAVGGKFTSSYTTWADVLQPYTKSLQIFRCPSNSKANSPVETGTSPAAATLHMAYGAAIYQVGDIINLAAFVDYKDRGTPSNLAQFSNVAETHIVGEIQNAVVATYAPQVAPAGSGLGENPYNHRSGTIHFEGSNWLYADGHVKYLLFSKVNKGNYYYWLRVKP